MIFPKILTKKSATKLYRISFCPLQDFGPITDKGKLPVGKATFNDVGGDKKGAYYVGWLQCAGQQFGELWVHSLIKT